MTSTNQACRAKNPSTCRFHGATRLAPQESQEAFKEVSRLSSQLRHPSIVANTEQYLTIREQLKEAEANYSITKQGYKKLVDEWEAATDANIADPTEANALNQFKATNAYFSAASNRQGILEEYSDALVEANFADKTDRTVAEFAMLNKFSQFEIDGNLDEELEHAGISREVFYSKLQEPKFAKKLAEVEGIFTQNAHETKDAHALIRPSHERAQLLASKGEAWDNQVYKMIESYTESLQS